MNFYVFLLLSQVFPLIPKSAGPITSAQGKNETKEKKKLLWYEQGIRDQEKAIGSRAKRSSM
jgi:hypothetical protein